MSTLDVDEINVVLRCVADNRPEFLEKAVLKGWKQCKICKYPICEECLKIFLPNDEISDNEAVCPGTYLKFNHNLEIEQIPTEIILIEAKKVSRLPKTGILIEKAFYIEEEAQNPNDSEIEYTKKFENQAISLAKQEHWTNMGTVIVKRNRGKYISWERI